MLTAGRRGFGAEGSARQGSGSWACGCGARRDVRVARAPSDRGPAPGWAPAGGHRARGGLRAPRSRAGRCGTALKPGLWERRGAKARAVASAPPPARRRLGLRTVSLGPRCGRRLAARAPCCRRPCSFRGSGARTCFLFPAGFHCLLGSPFGSPFSALLLSVIPD